MLAVPCTLPEVAVTVMGEDETSTAVARPLLSMTTLPVSELLQAITG